jgi:RNA polymerase sigma-70 factor (ECF subfamily)
MPDFNASDFDALRPRLTRIAYRMLGSWAEAEDVVQDAWLRWQNADRNAVRDPAAFLSRTVSRLSLDVLKSARTTRETYIGPWLPEPAVEDEAQDSDGITTTLMLALERLSPLERAAFLLHDVFGVDFDEIARTIDREPAACRQLAARAREHVRSTKTRFPVSEEHGREIAEAFFTATRSGDASDLRKLLASDVVVRSDGGGRVLAFRKVIGGVDRVLRLFGGLRRKWYPQSVLLYLGRIDGLPGFVTRERGNLIQTTTLDIEDGLITAVYIVRNPEKLGRISSLLGH